MIIHIAGSNRIIDENAAYFQAIVDAIAQTGNTLALNGLDHSRADAKQIPTVQDWTSIVNENLEAIRRADIILVEGTDSDFLSGYLMAVALEHKKPVFIVVREPLEDSVYAGIRHRMLTFKTYKTEKDLHAMVAQFIQDNTITTKDLRFNMFIDRPIHNYLRSMSHETGKNKSEIIRDLINREIQKKD